MCRKVKKQCTIKLLSVSLLEIQQTIEKWRRNVFISNFLALSRQLRLDAMLKKGRALQEY